MLTMERNFSLAECPVLSIAIEHEAMAAQYVAPNSDEVTLGARMSELAVMASELAPISREGAVFQIMLASAEVDTISLSSDELKSQVRASKLIVQRLAYRSLEMLRDGEFPYAKDYLMADEYDPRVRQEK
jgi:hypothetical protein